MKVASTSMGPGMKGGEKNKEKSLIPGPSWSVAEVDTRPTLVQSSQ